MKSYFSVLFFIRKKYFFVFMNEQDSFFTSILHTILYKENMSLRQVRKYQRYFEILMKDIIMDMY